jgi:hypothetical protein
MRTQFHARTVPPAARLAAYACVITLPWSRVAVMNTASQLTLSY